MKKTLIIFLAITIILMGINTVTLAENGGTEIKFNEYNALLSSTGISVFDSSYGAKNTGTDGNYYEVVVADGAVTSVGCNDSEIPENGFVIAAKGERYKNKLAEIITGDYCIVDHEASVILIIGENYDPFYEKTVSFDKYNSIRTANTIVIYNKGETTETNIWGNEVCVDANGYVTSIGGNDNKIPEGGFVISAVGADRIAELNDAAEIGLQVKIDDGKKTITFAYNPESVKAAVKIKLDYAVLQLEAADREYRLIDYKAAEERIEALKKYYNDVCTSIENNETAKAIVSANNFDKYYDTLYLLLEESPTVEGRALWIRPSGLTDKDAVAERVTQIKAMGFNIICLELFYDSTFICPMPEDGYFIQNPSLKGFDLLKAFIDECAKQGMELQGWLPVYRVSYSSSTYYEQSLAYKKPEWLCMSKKGENFVYNEYGNGYFVDPANQEATDYLLSVYEYLLKTYCLDGLQLDYIRYPIATGEDFGYTETARNEFKKQYGTDPIDIPVDGKLWAEWVDYRNGHVTTFVKKIVATVNDLSPMTTVSCDVAPNLTDSATSHLQNAKLWMNEGLINVAYPMAYGTNVVEMYAGYTVEACGDKVFAYIGVGDYGADIFIEQIRQSRKAEADGFAFFAYSQYVSGNYASKIASTILSKSALSPTYNCKAAAAAQLNTVISRLELMKDVVDATELKAYTDKISGLLNALESEKLSENADEIIALCDNFPEPSDITAASVLKSDLKTLKKIVLNNKDNYRTFTVNNENSGSDNNNAAVSGFPTWGYAVCGVIALSIIGAVIVIVDKKKKNTK